MCVCVYVSLYVGDQGKKGKNSEIRSDNTMRLFCTGCVTIAIAPIEEFALVPGPNTALWYQARVSIAQMGMLLFETEVENQEYARGH